MCKNRRGKTFFLCKFLSTAIAIQSLMLRMVSRRLQGKVFEISIVWSYIDIFFFFLKNSIQSKEKKKEEYFKKNNPRRDASITFLIIENRACYTFTFHVSRMQLVKPNVRPCKKKRAASFFHPGEKKPLPLPSLSPQKKRKEKNQTAEPTL